MEGDFETPQQRETTNVAKGEIKNRQRTKRLLHLHRRPGTRQNGRRAEWLVVLF